MDPNTKIRVFSKKLYIKSIITIDIYKYLCYFHSYHSHGCCGDSECLLKEQKVFTKEVLKLFCYKFVLQVLLV